MFSFMNLANHSTYLCLHVPKIGRKQFYREIYPSRDSVYPLNHYPTMRDNFHGEFLT